MSNWFEGVYDQGYYIGGGGGSDPFAHYGYSPIHPGFAFGAENMSSFYPQIPTGGGGGSTPGGGVTIDIPIGGGGGQSAPSTNQQMTAIVNDYERRLQINLGEWSSGQRSAPSAVEVGWSLMNAMVAALRAYGAAGERSAAERDRRINPAQLKWDWIAYYIDPIIGGPSTPPPLPPANLPGTGGAGGGVLPPGQNPVNDLFNNPMMLAVIGLLVIALAMRK